ncbi:hypothetical protein FNF29_01391 [Cafeteria roenbergensis]|uniref:Fibronectin type-III domain-containing protein n=1 Tax=Cafeteria roenbergensis TaxID=33653 RepID=A0A5A8CS69_CAFRO|nr:hypothetical protein FNF29_01391 [Cafeteria roenbergensis]|eukprot:KAA0155972.1 hypothetical protein FNF29_01391 [Cafeteria roenbergensis]
MAQAGSFEEWLAKVEDDEQAKAEEKRQAEAEAREAALRKQQSTEGAFETWVQGKAHRARAVEALGVMGRSRGSVDEMSLRIATALAVVDRQLGIPAQGSFPRGDGGGPRGTRTLAHDYLRWCRSNRVFERVAIPDKVLKELSPGLREMLDEKPVEGAAPGAESGAAPTSFSITNLSHAAQPEAPAPGMLPPPLSHDDAVKNALFAKTARAEWVAAQARVEEAVSVAEAEVREAREERLAGMSAAAAAAAREAAERADADAAAAGAEERPAPGSTRWAAFTKAGSAQLAAWAEEDLRSRAEADAAELREKNARGKAAHSGWLSRKEAQAVALPTAEEWERARLAEEAAKAGSTLAAARASSAARKRPPIGTTAALALEARAAVAGRKGGGAVHAPGDLQASRDALAERGFVFSKNFCDPSDGEIDDEGRERLQQAREQAAAAPWRVYEQQRRERSAAAFAAWRARKGAAASALRSLAVLPLAPDLPARAAVLASGSAAGGPGPRSAPDGAASSSVVQAAADSLRMSGTGPLAADLVRRAVGAGGPQLAADGRFVPVRAVRQSDVERWQGVGASLAGIGEPSLLTAWTVWSSPLFSAAECTAEWTRLREAEEAAAAAGNSGDAGDGSGDAAGDQACRGSIDRAEQGLAALRAAAVPHAKEAKGVQARLSGRAPGAPLLEKLATGLGPDRLEGVHASLRVAMPPHASGGPRRVGGPAAWLGLRWAASPEATEASQPAFFVVEACPSRGGGGGASGGASGGGRRGGAAAKGIAWTRVAVDPPPPSPDGEVEAASLACFVEGLRPGARFLVRARAINAFGASPFTFVEVAAQPEAPPAPVATARGARSLTVAWSAEAAAAAGWRYARTVFRALVAEAAARSGAASGGGAGSTAGAAPAPAQAPAPAEAAAGGSDPASSAEESLSAGALVQAASADDRLGAFLRSVGACLPAGPDGADGEEGRPSLLEALRAEDPDVNLSWDDVVQLALQGPAPSWLGRAGSGRWQAAEDGTSFELWALDAGDADTLAAAQAAGSLGAPGGDGWRAVFSGKGQQHSLADLRPGAPLLFAARAVNADGDVSEFSAVGVARTRLDRPPALRLAPGRSPATSLLARWGSVDCDAQGGAIAAVSAAVPSAKAHGREAATAWALGGHRPSGGAAADAALMAAALATLSADSPAAAAGPRPGAPPGQSDAGAPGGIAVRAPRPSSAAAPAAAPGDDHVPSESDSDDAWSMASDDSLRDDASGAGAGGGGQQEAKRAGSARRGDGRPPARPSAGRRLSSGVGQSGSSSSRGSPPSSAASSVSGAGARRWIAWSRVPALLAAAGVPATQAALSAISEHATALAPHLGTPAQPSRRPAASHDAAATSGPAAPPAAVPEAAIQAWLADRGAGVAYALQLRDATADHGQWRTVYQGPLRSAEPAELLPRRRYQLRVRAVAGPAASSWSAPVAAATAPLPPFAPTVVRTEPRGVTIRWHAAQGGASGFVVYGAVVSALGSRSAADPPAELEWEPLLQTSHSLATVSGLRPDTVYRLCVAAKGDGGAADSEPSFASQAVTPPAAGWSDPGPTQSLGSFVMETEGAVVPGDRCCWEEPVWATRPTAGSATGISRGRRSKQPWRAAPAGASSRPSGGTWTQVGTRTVVADVVQVDPRDGSVGMHVLWSRTALSEAAECPPLGAGKAITRTRADLAEAAPLREEWIDEAGRWSPDEEAAAAANDTIASFGDE